MANIKLCPRCGGVLRPISERTGGFSGKKAVVGAAVAGPVGVAAGALGKKLVTMQCEKCGYILETDEKSARKAEEYGSIYGPIEELERQIAKESYVNKRKSEILKAQLDKVLEVRLMPAREYEGTKLLTEKEYMEQKLQNAVLSIVRGLNMAAGVRADGTVIAAGLEEFDPRFEKEVQNLKNAVAVSIMKGSLAKLDLDCFYEPVIYVLCKNGTVRVAGGKAYQKSKKKRITKAFAEKNNIKTEQEIIEIVESWKNVIRIIVYERGIVALHENGTVSVEGNISERVKQDLLSWRNLADIEWAGSEAVGLQHDGTILYRGDFLSRKLLGINKNLGYDNYFGELAPGAADTFDELFGEKLLQKWTNVVAIYRYFNEVVGIRADGAVYAFSQAIGYYKSAKPKLELENSIISVGQGGADLFLRTDGSVLRSSSILGSIQNNEDKIKEIEAVTKDWENIVGVTGTWYFGVGIKADGSVVVTPPESKYESKEDYRKETDLIDVVKTWTDLYVNPSIKERILKGAEERREHEEKLRSMMAERAASAQKATPAKPEKPVKKKRLPWWTKLPWWGKILYWIVSGIVSGIVVYYCLSYFYGLL